MTHETRRQLNAVEQAAGNVAAAARTGDVIRLFGQVRQLVRDAHEAEGLVRREISRLAQENELVEIGLGLG